MRIGEFARINGISIDSIRHYIDLGLLLPSKENNQFRFDNNCQNDLERILELKRVGFTLKEILHIETLNRLKSPVSSVKKIYRDKLSEINRDIDRLKSTKEQLSRKTEDTFAEDFIIGISFESLKYLCCPNCTGELKVEIGSIEKGKIIHGNLLCNCGVIYTIKDGIIISPKNIIENEDPTGDDLDHFFKNSIEHLGDNLVEQIIRGIRELKDYIGDYTGKSIVEVGIGYGIFFQSVIENINNDVIYFGIDHNLLVLKRLKSILSKIISRDIILICCNYSEIPLQQNSTGLVIDIGGTSSYMMEKPELSFKFIDNLLNEDGGLMSLYSLVGKMNSLFTIDMIKQELQSIRLKEIFGNHESFMVKNEKVENYIGYFKRLG